MDNEDTIRMQRGVEIDSDHWIEFAVCWTSDGLLTCWGYDPGMGQTFEWAKQQLVKEIKGRGLKIESSTPVPLKLRSIKKQ